MKFDNDVPKLPFFTLRECWFVPNFAKFPHEICG
jgi:hypothetical protein